jgi:transposase
MAEQAEAFERVAYLRQVRNVLYMAALSSARYNLALKTHHNRLAAANKKPKVVIVAVMRKMITILNAMLRDNTAWQPRPA